MAIVNYNSLALRFSMVRGPATGCNATITVSTTTGTGGSAGFPSNGLPYSQVRVGTGLNSYSVDVVEHVITHELGHTLGMHHSDFYDRSISCGIGAGSEVYPGVGPIHIPGTPTTSTPGGSLMNACFAAGANGEFTSTDITAFRILYGL
jgi:hypothetical protein